MKKTQEKCSVLDMGRKSRIGTPARSGRDLKHGKILQALEKHMDEIGAIVRVELLQKRTVRILKKYP